MPLFHVFVTLCTVSSLSRCFWFLLLLVFLTEEVKTIKSWKDDNKLVGVGITPVILRTQDGCRYRKFFTCLNKNLKNTTHKQSLNYKSWSKYYLDTEILVVGKECISGYRDNTISVENVLLVIFKPEHGSKEVLSQHFRHHTVISGVFRESWVYHFLTTAFFLREESWFWWSLYQIEIATHSGCLLLFVLWCCRPQKSSCKGFPLAP